MAQMMDSATALSLFLTPVAARVDADGAPRVQHLTVGADLPVLLEVVKGLNTPTRSAEVFQRGEDSFVSISRTPLTRDEVMKTERRDAVTLRKGSEEVVIALDKVIGGFEITGTRLERRRAAGGGRDGRVADSKTFGEVVEADAIAHFTRWRDSFTAKGWTIAA